MTREEEPSEPVGGPKDRRANHVRIAQIMTEITRDGPLPYDELERRLDGPKRARIREIVRIAGERKVLQGLTADGDLPKRMTEGKPGAVQYVEIGRDAGCVIGINVGRTYYAIGVADPNGRLLSTAPYPKDLPAKEKKAAKEAYDRGKIAVHPRHPGVDGRALLREVAKRTNDWVPTVGVKPAEIRGATLSLPAPVSRTKSRLLTHSIERSLGSFEDIGDQFMASLGQGKYPKLREVILANDADVAARGEVRYGAGYGKKDVVVVHAAYGIGAGVMSDGNILRTAAGGGVGEIGHTAVHVVRDGGAKYDLIKLDPSDEVYVCACQQQGHLEAMAGGAAIVNRIVASLELVTKRPPPTLDQALTAPGGNMSAKLDAVIGATSGPGRWEPAREAMLDSAHIIGGAVHTLAHLFRPEAVYISGKLSEMGTPFLKGVTAGFAEVDSLEGYKPSIELGEASDEFHRRLIMVRGAAMTAVRGSKPLITFDDLKEMFP